MEMTAFAARAWRDGLVALVVFALTLALLGFDHGGTRSIDALGVVLAAVASFPLLARKRAPLAVFALTAAASATLNALGYAQGPPFGPTVALFFVAEDERTQRHIRRTAAVVLAIFAIHIAATASAHSGFPTSPVLFGIVVWGGAWIAGDVVRQRRQRRAESEERLERERRLAAAEERTRIARDLHDSAAHAINVILVQAGAARLLQRRDPEAAKTALTTIEDVARETIGEIDLLVRGLRESRDGEAVPVEPPTGLAALDTLVARYRAGGLAIGLRVDGEPRLLPRGLDQAAYRIVQESLTNAARHGSGGAEILIRYGEQQLELTIANPVGNGALADSAQGGQGILGMSERASLLGGALDARRRGDHFRVEARLPYASAEEKS
jgi:signal transduction histidine kinase